MQLWIELKYIGWIFNSIGFKFNLVEKKKIQIIYIYIYIYIYIDCDVEINKWMNE